MPVNIRPDFDLAAHLPADVAFAARTDLSEMRLLGMTAFHVDSIALLLLGLLNGRTTVRHRSGVTDEILEFLDFAGLEVAEDMLVYETAEQALMFARGLVSQGRRLFHIYPLPEKTHPVGAHLVPPSLWRKLNAKENLGQIVDPANLANRQVATAEELLAREVTGPVWLKLAGERTTGAGFAVRHCANSESYQSAIKELQVLDPGQRLIAEDDIPVTHCWCANLFVGEDAVTYLGSALQTFSSPGHQTGSLIDPVHPLPEAGAALAIAAGEVARKLGYVGPAGLDIGRTREGKLFVFDPNFRINASLSQVILHATVALRAGLPASLSVGLASSLPVTEILDRLRGPVRDLWFMPQRVIDATLLPAAGGQSRVTGFVLAGTAEELPGRQRALEQMLAT